MLIEKGRLCIKKYGRDAGSKAVIVDIEKNGFVKVLTTKRYKKERLCNPKHLEFLDEIIDINDRKQIEKALNIKAPATEAKQRA